MIQCTDALNSLGQMISEQQLCAVTLACTHAEELWYIGMFGPQRLCLHLNLYPRRDLTSATLSTDFKKRSNYYIHQADIVSSRVKLNFYCCQSKMTR